MKKNAITIGSGAGYAGDRIEPAVDLVKHGNLDYIVFECLAERTIALAQLRKMQNPKLGYDALLPTRMERILPLCHKNKVKLITNMGAANPLAALEKTKEIAEKHQLRGLKLAVVTGDDVSEIIKTLDPEIIETGQTLNSSISSMVSANAYLGAESIVAALRAGADVVITGRVADPALFLAPMIYEFGWDSADWSLLGRGTIIGHLLECAGQVTGGYYAEPGKKEVEGLGRLGFPVAQVKADGSCVITKLPSAGGAVTVSICKEQLLYEIGDPAAYITPDVTADFTQVSLVQTEQDKIAITGGAGRQRSQFLKVSIGYHQGYIGEGEIGYAGQGALARAKLASEIIRERLGIVGARYNEIRYDLLGVDSLHSGASSERGYLPYEVRVRVAAKTATKEEAALIGDEVETLYTNGPAAGGGARKFVREIIAVVSALIPRERVKPTFVIQEVDGNA